MSKAFAGYMLSVKGFALIAGLTTWTAALNLSTPVQRSAEDVLAGIFSLSGSEVIFFAPLIMIGLAYRYPKTIMVLTALGLATASLTPIAQSPEIAGYLWFLIPSGIAVLASASVFLGVKLRREVRVTV